MAANDAVKVRQPRIVTEVLRFRHKQLLPSHQSACVWMYVHIVYPNCRLSLPFVHLYSSLTSALVFTHGIRVITRKYAMLGASLRRGCESVK